MHTHSADRNAHFSVWLRVREYAVPPSMIQAATARRLAGDWAAACAAARVDVDLDLRALARSHGSQFASRIRADLRHLAPDLLRWHMPRIAPDGLLRPGLTLTLARYLAPPGSAGTAARDVHLVARTPPGWANAGQRISLALWQSDGAPLKARHPHPRPRARFRVDLHRHLWDARRTDELRGRSGADRTAELAPELEALRSHGWAVDRWADEGHILLEATEQPADSVLIRLGGTRRQLRLQLRTVDHPPAEPPVLPEAAARTLPDLELLRAGLIDPGQLHPLVAAALVPERPRLVLMPPPAAAQHAGAQPRFVDCRGERHRIGLRDGVLSALDHDPGEVRREELLVALTGTPLPCLVAIDEAHRRPECLTGVRERLDHGDTTGALDLVEGLLGAGAVLRSGALLDELEAARQGRIAHGLFRAGLSGGRPLARPARAPRQGRARRVEVRGRVRNASSPR